MTELNPPAGPASFAPARTLYPRPFLFRLLAEHNPFYLLSAACMLASCLALTNSLSWTSIDTGRLLTLIVTLNLYEAALLAIALFLVTRRRLARDGRMLLVLQFFFLADFTFLNAEITTASLRTGVLLNAGLFLLAAIKLGIVLRVLKPSFTALQFAFVLVQLAAVYAIPCVLRWLDVGQVLVGPRHLYVVWWVAGLLPALYEVVAHLDRRSRDGRPDASAAPWTANAAPTTVYLVLPYLSLLTHIGILHYVYDVGFYGAHATPLLLGLALVLNRLSPTTLVPRRDLAFLRLALPLAAVLVSANDPFAFPIRDGYPRLTLTSFTLAIAGAYLVYVYCFLRPRARLFLATGAAAAALYLVGPSRRQLVDGARDVWEFASRIAERLVPKTVTHWGALGLIASFAFLAIGLWISLRKRPDVALGDGHTGRCHRTHDPGEGEGRCPRGNDRFSTTTYSPLWSPRKRPGQFVRRSSRRRTKRGLQSGE